MSTLPDEIVASERGDGEIQYELPVRPLGRARHLGWFPMVLGMICATFALIWMMGVSWMLIAGGAPGPLWMRGLFVLGGVPFIVGGLTILVFGLFMLAGRTTIRVTRDRLWSIEKAGWISWRRRCSLEGVRVVRLVSGRANTPEGQSVPPPLRQLAMLQAEGTGKPFRFAVGYPREWLTALAEDLGPRCRRLTETGEWTPIAVELGEPEPVARSPLGLPRRVVRAQPEDSAAEVEEHADGVTIQLPPAGVGRGSRGLFAFSLVWLGFMLVFSVVMGVGMFAARGDKFAPWLIGAFTLVFWGIGLVMLASAIQMGRRRAVLAVAGGHLLILQTGPLGTKRQEWPADAVEGVEVGPSGLSVNDRPVLELQVIARAGETFGVLAGRDEEELHWLATRLRAALKIPEVEPDAAEEVHPAALADAAEESGRER